MMLDGLRTLSQIRKALWADPEKGAPAVVDAYSSVSLLELPEEEAMERTILYLLQKAIESATAVNRLREMESAHGTSQRFYTLHPVDRFILVALHLENWSYTRTARLLQFTVEELEKRAWQARIQAGGHYPIGSPMESASCPEYEARRPWIQRFLDEEISNGTERLFLQNHLMACAGCRRSLQSCRDLYYAVDALIPRVSDSEPDTAKLIENLKSVHKQSQNLLIRSKAKNQNSISRGSFIQFLIRPDILIVTFGLIYLIRLMLR